MRRWRATPTGCRTRALFSSELLREYFRRHGTRRVRRRQTRATPPRPRSRTRSPRLTRRPPHELARHDSPAAALLRAAGATRGPQHVRARRAGAEPRGREGCVRGRLGAERHRDRRGRATPRARRRRDARPASAPGAGRPTPTRPARARRGPRADVHAAPESRARSRWRRRAWLTVTNSFENKTPARDERDLVQPDHGRAEPRRARRRARRGGPAGRTTSRHARAGSEVRWSRSWADVVRRRSDGARRGACWRAEWRPPPPATAMQPRRRRPSRRRRAIRASRSFDSLRGDRSPVRSSSSTSPRSPAALERCR